MNMTLELAMHLVQVRQVLFYLSVILAFVLILDTILNPKRLKRKITISVFVIFLAITQIVVESLMNINIFYSLCWLVCVVTYATIQTVRRVKRRKKRTAR